MYVLLIQFNKVRPISSSSNSIISFSIFQDGKLNWIPKIEYVGGRVIVYHFWDSNEISMENLRTKSKTLGNRGLHCLYYRKPKLVIEGGLVLIRNKGDVIVMKGYAKQNDVRHEHEEALGSLEAANIFGMSEWDGSNDVGDWNNKLDDYDFVDSDYSITNNDILFSKNVDEQVEWVGRLREELGLRWRNSKKIRIVIMALMI